MTLLIPDSALIVDDEAHVRTYVKLLLKNLGVREIFEAADVVEARGLWQQHRPELLMLDINMPGESGIEFLTELRKVDEDSLVVMLSANAQLGVIRQAVAAGANGFIRKDSPKDAILAELKVIFEVEDEPEA